MGAYTIIVASNTILAGELTESSMGVKVCGIC